MALGILAVAMTLGVKALAWSAALRRQADQRQLALQEAINCLEQVRQVPWERLDEDNLAEIKLSTAAAEHLDAAHLRILPETSGDKLEAVKVRVQIEWQSRYSGAPWQVELATWRYRTQSNE